MTLRTSFGRVSLAHTHESIRLVAQGSSSGRHCDRRGLYGLLGFDWTATLGLIGYVGVEVTRL